MSRPLDLEEVRRFLKAFAVDRDWEQFHTPKNLAMALAGEAGELLELFQWLTPEESERLMADPDRAHAVGDEIADILQYLVRLADVLGLDLGETVWRKLHENEARYPAGEVKGDASKRDGSP